jgi:hypothetical protein
VIRQIIGWNPVLPRAQDPIDGADGGNQLLARFCLAGGLDQRVDRRAFRSGKVARTGSLAAREW